LYAYFTTYVDPTTFSLQVAINLQLYTYDVQCIVVDGSFSGHLTIMNNVALFQSSLPAVGLLNVPYAKGFTPGNSYNFIFYLTCFSYSGIPVPAFNVSG
jgi:hypothetical protein